MSVKMNKVLAHYIIKDENALQPIQVGENPVQNIIHVSLAEEQVSRLILTWTGGRSQNVPFTLLEVNACMGCEESMARACRGADASRLKVSTF